MSLEHTNTNIESTPEMKPNPVAETQLRTRDKVFGMMGSTWDLSLDITKAGLETTAYTLGKAYRTALDVKDQVRKGSNNEPFQLAA